MSDAQPSQIAVAVVRREDCVLIGQRPAAAVLGGYWEFPGGKVLPGESPQRAAARECREETGLEIRVSDRLGVAEHEYAHGRVCLHFFAGEPVDPGQTPAAPFQWVPMAELHNYRFPPANQQVIRQILAALGQRATEQPTKSP